MINFQKFNLNSDTDKWNLLVKKINDNNLCLALSPHFGLILSELYKMDLEYYLILDKIEEIGLLVGLKKNNKFYSMPVLSNGGIFLFNNVKYNTHKLYKSFFSKNKYKYEVKSFDKFSRFCFSNKITVYKNLPHNQELLISNFKSKLRSQINKGYKNGLSIKINDHGAINDFYKIYSKNMHRLGTPVVGISYFLKFIQLYPTDKITFFTVYLKNKPIGASICFSYINFFEVMWASTNINYNKLNTNMILYYEMMKYAVNIEMKIFSFGRSDVDSGSLKFKQQWGAVNTIPIHFNYDRPTKNIRSFKLFSKLWKLIPYKLTLIIGPYLRKHIIN